jgi:hypothetical protein
VVDQRLLIEADRVVAALSPGKRESVREIVVDATRRGSVTGSARRFLDSVTGSPLVAEVLAQAVAEGADATLAIARSSTYTRPPGPESTSPS